jgi:ribosome maturation factor RimP
MLRDQLVELLGPVVADLGYELWELEYTGQSGSGLLRLYIDSAEGISVDDCERVSRAVSAAMDVADPIASNYTLEVSSPGLDRVLRKREHFARFTGEQVRVETVRTVGGRKRFAGLLVKVEGDEITLEVDGSTVSLPVDGINKARLAPEL